jgi:hypothetical protein
MDGWIAERSLATYPLLLKPFRFEDEGEVVDVEDGPM